LHPIALPSEIFDLSEVCDDVCADAVSSLLILLEGVLAEEVEEEWERWNVRGQIMRSGRCGGRRSIKNERRKRRSRG
jgi:hypothetical protein